MNALDGRILDKIKKCLALSSSDNPNEAAAALERAQELMAKYGVSAEQLAHKVTDDQVTEGRVRSCASATRCKDWELKLFRAIAKAFGCDMMFARGVNQDVQRSCGLPSSATFGHYIFVGLTEDVAVASYAATVLQKQLSRGRAAFTHTLIHQFMSRAAKTHEVDAYCNGWVDGAVTKVKPLADAKKRAAEAQDRTAGTSTALMVVSKEEQKAQALKRYMDQNAGPKVPVNERSGGTAAAHERGYQEGLAADVHRPLSAGTSTAKGKLS